MLACAIDVRRGSMRLVLVANTSRPEILEGCCLRDARPERVLARLRAWQEEYQGARFTLVCCHADSVPSELLEALESAGYEVEWVGGYDVAVALAAWNWKRVDPRWLRAGLMAFLLESPLSANAVDEAPDVAAWRWLQLSLRQQLAELEPWLGVASSEEAGGETRLPLVRERGGAI